MLVLALLLKTIAGVREEHSPALLADFPELARVRLRRGGLLPRVGGWCLGQSTVAGITLGRTVWLGTSASPSAELLLHELRHVHQFESVRAFPLRYVWESLRRGYHHNRFETDARRFAAERLRTPPELPFSEDV
ncbi:MAG: hypothetical protein IT360_24630 [Gemmatimonadaceae bacterium]|nr:hypothetical protein [Gemmatimonadaceae bacterium]